MLSVQFGSPPWVQANVRMLAVELGLGALAATHLWKPQTGMPPEVPTWTVASPSLLTLPLKVSPPSDLVLLTLFSALVALFHLRLPSPVQVDGSPQPFPKLSMCSRSSSWITRRGRRPRSSPRRPANTRSSSTGYRCCRCSSVGTVRAGERERAHLAVGAWGLGRDTLVEAPDRHPACRRSHLDARVIVVAELAVDLLVSVVRFAAAAGAVLGVGGSVPANAKAGPS